MSSYDNSLIRLGNLFVDVEPYRGGIGPTGPTGDIGNIGPVGNIGPRGTGISVILKNGADGVTVFLTNGTAISVTGLSGNTFTDYASIIEFYTIEGATGIVNNESFEIKGVVQGFTANFKSLQFIGGISAIYSNNDIKIFNITGSTTRIGVPGNILTGISNDVSSGLNVNIFKYEENTVGITTVPVLKAKLHSFILGNVSTNRNVVNAHTGESIFNINQLITGSTQNIYFPQIVFNATARGMTMIDTISTEHAKVVSGRSTKRINLISNILPTATTKVPYSVYEYGSCCHCNSVGLPRCKDFINRDYCESSIASGGLGGVFSFKSCEQRKTEDCTAISKCCIGGICLDLEMGECARLGGVATEGSLCTDEFDCS